MFVILSKEGQIKLIKGQKFFSGTFGQTMLDPRLRPWNWSFQFIVPVDGPNFWLHRRSETPCKIYEGVQKLTY